jgi:hypothetical protein
VENEVIECPMVLSKSDYLSYLRTWSGYNIYLQQQ